MNMTNQCTITHAHKPFGLSAGELPNISIGKKEINPNTFSSNNVVSFDKFILGLFVCWLLSTGPLEQEFGMITGTGIRHDCMEHSPLATYSFSIKRRMIPSVMLQKKLNPQLNPQTLEVNNW
jgi:hypothetical protein